MIDGLKETYDLILIELVPSKENNEDMFVEANISGWLNDYPEITEKVQELLDLIDDCTEDYVKKNLYPNEVTSDETDSN